MTVIERFTPAGTVLKAHPSDTTATTVGNTFYVEPVAGGGARLLGIWHYRPVAQSTTPVGAVWPLNNTTPIATVTFDTSSVVGWQYKALPTPVDLDPARYYVVGTYTSGRYACWGANYPNATAGRGLYWAEFGIQNPGGSISIVSGPGVRGVNNGALGALGSKHMPSPASGPSAGLVHNGHCLWGGSQGLQYPAVVANSSAAGVAQGDLYGSDVSVETVETRTSPLPHGGKTSSFVEAFDGPLDARWNLLTGPAMPVPSGGSVAIPPGTSIGTKQAFDLVDDHVILKLPDAGMASSDTSCPTLQLGNGTDGTATWQVYTTWSPNQNVQAIRLVTFQYGARTELAGIRWEPTLPYLRLRESDGLILLDVAAGGAGPWFTVATFEHRFRPAQLRALRIHLRDVGTTRAIGPVMFDDLNVPVVDESVSVPSPSTMAWLRATPGVIGTRWTGAGVKCAVVDQGTTPAVRARMGVALATRIIVAGASDPDANEWRPWRRPASIDLITDQYGNPGNHHGCAVAPCMAPPGALLVDVIVHSYDGSATFAQLAAGLKAAADAGAKVINLSFGGLSDSPLYTDAFNYLASKNVLVFAAAGNGGADGVGDPALEFPARYSNSYPFVHSVGAASEYTNKRAGFSNHTATMTGLAPGDTVFALTPTGKRRTIDGTSFAAPAAAGLAVRLLTDGVFTVAQVNAALKATRRKLSGVPDAEQGGGAYDFQAAALLLAGDPDWPPPDGPTRAIVDPFTTTPAAPAWTVAGTVTATGGVVSLAGDSSIRSTFNGDLKNSAVIVEAVDVVAEAGVQCQVRLGRDPTNWVVAYTAKTSGGLNGLTIGVYNAGQLYIPGFILHDPVVHRWWRILESGGYIALETSPDANAPIPVWTTRISYSHRLSDRALSAMPVTLACTGTRSTPARYAHLNTSADPEYLGLIPTARTRAWMGDTLSTAAPGAPGADTLWHGRDVTVAVIDDGTNAAVRARQGLTLVARREFAGSRAADGVELYPDQDHGCSTSACAVPQGGRVVDAIVCDREGLIYVSACVAAMRWAADRAKVINFSIGGEFDHPAWSPALAYIEARGSQIFIAAGNDNQARLSYPAAYSVVYPCVHSVGAFDELTGARADFSNHTASMSGVAPGEAVMGLLPSGRAVTVRGTSFAGPLTARLGAKLLTGGRFTPAQAGVALDRTTRDTGQPRIDQGGGAFDLGAAIAQIGNPIGVGLLPAFALPRFRDGQWADVAETFNAIPDAVESLGRTVTLRYGVNGSYATLGSGIQAAVPWQVADSDSYPEVIGGMWTPTIPELIYALEDGRYTITCQVRFPNVTHDATVVAGVAPYNVGRRIGALLLNGYDLTANVIAIDDKPANSDLWGVTISLIADTPLRAGDFVAALIVQTSGGTVECLSAGWGGTSFGMTRTGPIGVDVVADVA